ncbi:RagB/SusD family nutrient uptake outer membrane protein [Puteibacter caeruleilacunae]|nr:RagB/SusD family nutrient uptake outer membrane protein [Puteibacter caeruleilacunae]
MKYTKYIIGLCLSLIFGLYACQDDILDKQPPGDLSASSFWIDAKDADAGLAAVYDVLNPGKRNGVGWGLMVAMDMYTPIGNHRSSSERAIAEGIHTPSYGIFNKAWEYGFKGVVRANDFLTHIDDIEFSENDADLKEIMKGEARFLRGMYYYYLVENFGGVPLFTDVPGVDQKNAERASKEQVISLIKDDLNFAIDVLPNEARDVGRATKGAAMALRVKLALHEKDWATAATVSKEILDMRIYDLVPNYSDIFSFENENNEEVIFDVQNYFEGIDNTNQERGGPHEKLMGGRESTANGWTWCQPTRWLVDQFEVIDPNPVYTQEDERIPTEIYDYLEGRDPRMDATIIRPGAHYLNFLGEDELYPYQYAANNHSQVGMHIRKNVIYGAGRGTLTNGDDSPLNWIVFRYADILLCHLEAVAMRDGVTSVSQEILDATINKVRQRASTLLPIYTAGDITMEDIYLERIRELAFEGWTLIDMRRSGMIEINEGYVVSGFSVGAEVGFKDVIGNVRKFDPAIHYLWPIPQSEREKSNFSLTQNPGYPE